ncbi:Protein of unknown function [Aquamicrobium aerolatum DSM 21857]|uniref:DUF2783 domain-containing protein n=2 Tax=Aerobium TaxID=3143707 RepID=A0A1I3HI39_9HYPH|nr:Protein of unknown function [Aquamicrobium aerolatum DSM 21857]
MATRDGENYMSDHASGGDRLGLAGDDFYAALMAAHDGLTYDESARLNARLVLLMANAIGDLEELQALLAAARKG